MHRRMVNVSRRSDKIRINHFYDCVLLRTAQRVANKHHLVCCTRIHTTAAAIFVYHQGGDHIVVLEKFMHVNQNHMQTK